jgi:hypothetical protein
MMKNIVAVAYAQARRCEVPGHVYEHNGQLQLLVQLEKDTHLSLFAMLLTQYESSQSID